MQDRDIKEIKHKLVETLSKLDDSIKITCAEEIARLKEISQIRDDEKFIKDLSSAAKDFTDTISELELKIRLGRGEDKVKEDTDTSPTVIQYRMAIAMLCQKCDLFKIDYKLREGQKLKEGQQSSTDSIQFEEFDDVGKLGSSKSDMQKKAPLRKTKATTLAARTWQSAKSRSNEEDVKALNKLAEEAKEKRESSSSGSDEKKDRKPKK